MADREVKALLLAHDFAVEYEAKKLEAAKQKLNEATQGLKAAG